MFKSTRLLSVTLALVSLANLVTAAPQPVSALTKRASVCNGDASLCSRLYSNITYIGAHNSYAVGTIAGASTGKNQEQSVTQQLTDGIRLLQVQARKNASSSSGSGLHLCHSSCSLENGGTLESYLTLVKSWIDSNPNDVVTLLIVNSDDQPVSSFATAFQSTGLASKAYSPGTAALSKYSWPTLGSLIDTGKNLVVFIDNSADVSSVPYILPHFQNTWENPYDQTLAPFNCSIDRINSGSNSADLMYLINHYLDSSLDFFGTQVLIPDTTQLNTTNSLDSILTDANNCASLHGAAYPTYVLTDFYDVGGGSVFEAAARMNGVQYVQKAIGNATKSGANASASAADSVRVNAGGLVLGLTTLGVAVLVL